MSKIKGILACFTSTRDSSGNCYHAFRYTSTATGQNVEGSIVGGESNINAIRYELFAEDSNAVYFYTKELPKREFKRLTAEMVYLGCSPFDLANQVVERLSGKRSTFEIPRRERLDYKEEEFQAVITKHGGEGSPASFVATADQASKIANEVDNIVRYIRVKRITPVK